MSLGDLVQAIDYSQQYLTLAREIGSRLQEANALCNLGICLAQLKQYSEALEDLQRSVEICREIGNPQTEAYANALSLEITKLLRERP